MLQNIILAVRDTLWGLPLTIFVVAVGLITTVCLSGIQFRKFFSSWSLIFAKDENTVGEISPLQAFVNALSASLGNGSIAGIAVAVQAGGPGAVFWIFVIGFLGMILRFAEVYLATFQAGPAVDGRVLGGPFIYLSRIPGGTFLPYIYALFCLLYGCASGGAMQANAITGALTTVASISPLTISIVLTLFVLYVLLGGAQRIATVSDYIVPLKVILFFSSCSAVILYHWASLPAAFSLIFKSAFQPQALGGALLGVTVQQLFRLSLTRAVNASEAGLGTAAIIYGSTGTNNPLKSSLSAMLSTFISVNLVCTMVALSIVVSGVWNSGATGSVLTSLAFQTVFGTIGGWIVTALSVLFGVGVFVAYSFIGRECWLFLTGNRFVHGFTLLFCAAAFIGGIIDISVVWAAIDIINAGCLIINLFGILWLLPLLRARVNDATV